MRVTLVRHATLVVDVAGTRILIDPALDPAGSQPPIDDTPNPRSNPLVELPATPAQIVAGVDAAIVTHLHQDHLDATGGTTIRGLPVYCQPSDVRRLAHLGLTAISLTPTKHIGAASVAPTAGRHGAGALGASLGPVCGVVLRAAGEPTLYVAGDTVLCEEVLGVISTERPDVVVVNAGAAQFVVGDPVTMTEDDVVRVARAADGASIIAVHMEAFNHCLLTRPALRSRLAAEGLGERVHVPNDGTAFAL
jgi:L-ascorbate metabolism protein UlaG (beta-lactamase superfamily)